MLEFELVLPAYNEGKTLPTLIGRAVEAAKTSGYSPERFQLVVVQNGSRDNSSEVLNDLKTGALGPWFRVVTVEQNQGYGYGLWQGLSSTSAPFVAWSHADMQCDPKDAFTALNLLRSEGGKSAIIKGVRFGRNWKDRFVSRVFEIFAFVLLGLKVYEINAQPKVFPRELLSSLKKPPLTFAFDLYVLYHAAKLGYKTKTVEVLFPPRVHGVSKWASTFLGRYKTILGMIRYMRVLAKDEGRL